MTLKRTSSDCASASAYVPEFRFRSVSELQKLWRKSPTKPTKNEVRFPVSFIWITDKK
jgi:hypothetical protein